MGSLRFLLALAVAGGHAASMFGFAATWIMPGSRAVQIFYIISGFLMAMILNGKYADTPRGNWIFYTNRGVKIFAPYLVILAVTLATCLLSKVLTGNALLLNPWFTEAGNMTFATWAFAILTNIFIVGQEWGFLLIYRAGSLFFDLQAFEHPPMATQFIVILPAWTLSIELLFYVLAPFILRRNVVLIFIIAYLIYRLRFEAYSLGFNSEATTYRFFPFEVGLFLWGAVCFKIGTALPSINKQIAAAITVALILTVTFLPPDLGKGQHRLYFWIGLFLPVLLEFGRRYRWDRSLGELSYPLYLVHWPVGAFLAALLGPGSAIDPILAVLLSIGIALLINRGIVKPLDDWRQKRITVSNKLSPASWAV